MTCLNCGGSDTVQYIWYLDFNSEDDQLRYVPFRTYGTVSQVDGQLELDVDVFRPVITNESFALVFIGSYFARVLYVRIHTLF